MDDAKLPGTEAIDGLANSGVGARLAHSVFRVGDWAVEHKASLWHSSYSLVVRHKEFDGELTLIGVDDRPLWHLIGLFRPEILTDLGVEAMRRRPAEGSPGYPHWEAEMAEIQRVAADAARLNYPAIYTPILWDEQPPETRRYLDPLCAPSGREIA